MHYLSWLILTSNQRQTHFTHRDSCCSKPVNGSCRQVLGLLLSLKHRFCSVSLCPVAPMVLTSQVCSCIFPSSQYISPNIQSAAPFIANIYCFGLKYLQLRLEKRIEIIILCRKVSDVTVFCGYFMTLCPCVTWWDYTPVNCLLWWLFHR